MSSVSSPVERRPIIGDVVGPLLWLVPALLLAIVSRLGVGTAVGIGIGSAAVALLLGSPRIHLGPVLPLLPGLVALGVTTATVPPGPLTDMLAGAGGLGLLLALARGTVEPDRRWEAMPAVLLPAVGLGLALATSFLFPPSDRLVGVAATLLLACVAALALLVRRPMPGGVAGARAS